MKAIHNIEGGSVDKALVVSYHCKVIFWKLFTTYSQYFFHHICCVLPLQGNILKAIHNRCGRCLMWLTVVSYHCKVIFWKLFTTQQGFNLITNGCVLPLQGNILKAIHNGLLVDRKLNIVVSYHCKVIFWKLFTTYLIRYLRNYGLCLTTAR